MLSDFVFHLIHRFCFRRVLYGYMKYLFTTRIQNYYFTEIHGKTGLFSKEIVFSSDFIKSDAFLFQREIHFADINPLKKFIDTCLNKLKKYCAILDFFYIVKCAFLTCVINRNFLNKYLTFKLQNAKQFKRKLYVYKCYHVKTYNDVSFFFSKIRDVSTNIYVSMYLLLLFKKYNNFRINKKKYYVFSEQYFHVIVRYYLDMFYKTVGFKYNFMCANMKLYLKQNIQKGTNKYLVSLYNDFASFYKNKRKTLRDICLETHNIELKSFFFFLKTSVGQLNNVFFRYFFLKKINNLKKINTLNYSHILNTKYKKDLLISLKKRLHFFRRRL